MTDAQQTYPDGVASAVTYCRDVLSGAHRRLPPRAAHLRAVSA